MPTRRLRHRYNIPMPAPPRRWFAFRLRTLLWAVACLALYLWLLTFPLALSDMRDGGPEGWKRRRFAENLDLTIRTAVVAAIFSAPYAAGWLTRRSRSLS